MALQVLSYGRGRSPTLFTMSRSKYSSTFRAVIGSGRWRDENDEKSRPSLVLPVINVLDQNRWFSTSSANRKNTLRQTADRMREKASEIRESVSEKASELKQQAAESAKKGAKVTTQKGSMSMSTMLQQYGPVFVGSYFSLYLVTLGSLYGGISSGYIDPMTLLTYIKGDLVESTTTAGFVTELMEKWSITRPYAPMIDDRPYLANLGVAWVATKFTEPVRIIVTSAAVPQIYKRLGFVVDEDESEDDGGDEASSEKATNEENADSSEDYPSKK